VIDALAKIPSGLIQANINWIGDYKGCNDIIHHFNSTQNYSIPSLNGKYCRASIGFPFIDELVKFKYLSKD
jgi:hypothetical protein